MLKRLTVLLFVLSLGFFSKAQLRDSFAKQAAFISHFHYSYLMTGGDFGERFGNTNSVGVGVSYKTKSNWLIDVDYSSMFGSRVRENVLNNLFASGGGIINSEGVYEEIKLFQRGSFGFLSLGKVIRFGHNQNSGLLVKAGVGYLQHKIKLVYDEEFVPALAGDRYKGYDRLTNGLATYQFLGYQFLDPGKRVDFYFGMDFIQGYTQSRRSWDWDLRQRDTKKRSDLAIGLRFGIIMPFYLKDRNQEVIFD